MSIQGERRYALPGYSERDYLTIDEYKNFMLDYNIKDSKIHKGITTSETKQHIKFNTYEVPVVYFKIKKFVPQKYFDFSNCKKYFIMQFENFEIMTILINESIERGYRIKMTDMVNKTVEMELGKTNFTREGF